MTPVAETAGLGSLEDTGGLGAMRFRLDDTGPTPASQLAVRTIGERASLFRGRGIDWGAGRGYLAIAAAFIPTVERVVGLEIVADDVRRARENARLNGVDAKATFLHADSYDPFPGEDAAPLLALRGCADFLIANPPASDGDDGLSWRRRALAGGKAYLRPGAPVLVQVSYQYNQERIERLARDVGGYEYECVAGSTGWVPFDISSENIPALLSQYAAEERRGGLPYLFEHAVDGDDRLHQTATDALARYQRTGAAPRSKWQVHLFRYVGRD